MADFKARAYGKRKARVVYGKEHILEQTAPPGQAIKFCRKLADELNKLVDDAFFSRGKFRAGKQDK